MFALRTFALLTLASLVHAQGAPAASYDRAGSLLLFCEYDNRPGNRTLLTVTNTSATDSVIVQFRYISEGTCLEFNRNEALTPFDTLTVLADVHTPLSDHGYVFVEARSVSGQQPIVHNHLTGSAIQVTSLSTYDYSYNALAYRGVGAAGTLTDVDNDGIRDLDGIEYAGSPELESFPRFLGVSFTRPSELILVNLTGGRQFTAVLNFLLWNDNEEVFSAQYQFNCWARVPLTTISGAFSNTFLQNATNHDPSEVFGASTIESGWLRIDGEIAFSSETTIQDPAFHAMLIESARRISLSGSSGFPFFSLTITRSDTAVLPFYEGVQFNGDLLPTGVFGDGGGIGLGG